MVILHDGEYVIGKDVGPDEDVDFVGFSKSGTLSLVTTIKTQLADNEKPWRYYLWSTSYRRW